MKKFNLQIATLLLLVQFSCQKKGDPSPVAPLEIQDKSTAMFNGEVVETDSETEDSIELWEVKVKNAENEVVKFYWRKDTGQLHEIDGQEAPFVYEVTPGMGLITYSAAKTQAIAALKNDKLLRWQLQKESDFANAWVYRFEFDDDGTEKRVYVDATTGNILEID